MSAILTAAEVAERLRITTRTLRNMHHQGIAPASMRLSDGQKMLRYRLEDVEAWEASRVTGRHVPKEAKNAMIRAAMAFDKVLEWKGMPAPARGTLDSIRKDLRRIALDEVAP